MMINNTPVASALVNTVSHRLQKLFDLSVSVTRK